MQLKRNSGDGPQFPVLSPGRDAELLGSDSEEPQTNGTFDQPPLSSPLQENADWKLVRPLDSEARSEDEFPSFAKSEPSS